MSSTKLSLSAFVCAKVVFGVYGHVRRLAWPVGISLFDSNVGRRVLGSAAVRAAAAGAPDRRARAQLPRTTIRLIMVSNMDIRPCLVRFFVISFNHLLAKGNVWLLRVRRSGGCRPSD